MIIPAQLLHVLLFLPVVSSQASIEDFISRAFSIIRPIFDTSAPLKPPDILVPEMSDVPRDTVLGPPTRTALSDVPICRGDSKICEFISCQAENFKNDQSFSNLNLAAQVLGDKKLRQAIGNNPEAIGAVCQDQGMDDAQCALFTKGFQLINRFMNTIEKPIEEMQISIPEGSSGVIATSAEEVSAGETIPDPPLRTHADAVRPTLRGSKTWSSQVDEPTKSVTQEMAFRNDLISNLTPLPPMASFHPTPPTAPPLAFNTVPSVIIPPLPGIPDFLKLQPMSANPFEKLFAPMKIEPILRSRRHTSDRTKREDYYDTVASDTTAPSRRSGSRSRGSSGAKGHGKDTGADEYYDEVDNSHRRIVETKNKMARRNCMELLG